MTTTPPEFTWSMHDHEEDVPLVDSIDLLLLPRAYRPSDAAPMYPQSTKSVVKLLSQAGVRCSLVPATGKTIFVEERSADWIAPTLFVTAAVMSSSPEILNVALGVIANYVTNFLQEGGRPKTVRVEVISEKTPGRSARKATYEGPAEGLKHLPDTWIDGPTQS